MADTILSSHSAILDDQSFYNVLRTTGRGSTPFWDSLGSGIAFKGNPKKGHKFGYRPQPTAGEDNAYAEGSKRADISSWGEVELSNELQIFKKTSGITDSEAHAMDITQKRRRIETQQASNRVQMRLDIERALLSGALPIKANALTDIRRMGGVKSYIQSLAVFDVANGKLSIKNHIDEALQLMFIKGIAGEKVVVMCGVKAFTELQFMYSERNQLTQGDKSIQNVKTHIISAWFAKAEIQPNPNLEANEILIYAPSLVRPVLLRQVKDRKCGSPEFDIDVTEDIIELTLQVEDPFATVHIKNIGA